MGILVIVPPYPTVPALPGVPPLNRAPGLVGAVPVPAAFSDGAGVNVLAGAAPRWGLVDTTGSILISPTSIFAFEIRDESKVPNYSIERGGFSSYNKVRVPYELRVTMTKRGALGDRTAFLNAVEAAKNSLDLFTVLTPEKSWPSVNVVRYDMNRTSNSGVTMLTVNLTCQLINVTSSGTLSNTANPNGAPVTSGGNVQAVAPTPPQSSSISPPAPSPAPVPTVLV